MTQSDNNTADNVQSVSDVRDMEVVKEEVGEQVGDTQEDVTRQLQGYKRCDIAKDYVERFDLDELSELTGVDRSAVRDHVDYWLARGQVVKIGQKKHGKSVFSCKSGDIAEAKTDEELEEIDADELAEKLRTNKEDTVDIALAGIDTANSDSAGEGGDSENEGENL